MRWVVVLLLLGGCSFAFSRPPKAPPVSDDVCLGVAGLAAVDAVATVSSVILGAVAVSGSGDVNKLPSAWEPGVKVVGIGLLVTAGGFLASTIFGGHQYLKCRDVADATPKTL